MSTEQSVRIVQYGLGPIGIECVKTVMAKADCGLQLVGAIDVDPEKAGRDVSAIIGMDAPTGIEVSADAAAQLSTAKPDVVLHTTTSFLDKIFDQFELCVGAGAHVVSSTEELLYPYERHPRLSARLDELARTCGVSVLGTGVNPGFVMDTLALIATGACRSVDRIEADRVVDAGRRRLPLQLKVGAGLTIEAFEKRKQAGTIGHIGLLESALLVAAGMNWRLDRVVENLDPVVATEAVFTEHLQVQPGEVAGIHHTVEGYRGDERVLALDLKMYVGAREPRDAVGVDGGHPSDLEIRNGVFGDTATVGALINAIPLVRSAAPGLHTMKDLPLPRALGPIF
jgi:4-hydroxy-tetrahydrodipicolinate reductase